MTKWLITEGFLYKTLGGILDKEWRSKEQQLSSWNVNSYWYSDHNIILTYLLNNGKHDDEEESFHQDCNYCKRWRFLPAKKLCFSRSVTAMERDDGREDAYRRLLSYIALFQHVFNCGVTRRCRIYLLTYKVLFQQVFNCCGKRRCRFHLLALKFCFSRSLTAVGREDADFIC